MGVPPEKVADVMALMGDSIDNIPGAKGIGEKGARELIRRFGSSEAALDHAAEVEGKRYREALINSKEQVALSKQLATIAADAPIELDLKAVERRESPITPLCAISTPSSASPRSCAICPPPPRSRPSATDYATLDSPAAVARVPERHAARPAHRRLAHARSRRARNRRFRLARRRLRAFARSQASRAPPGATTQARIAGALAEFLADPQRPKIVHDPKLTELLAGPVQNIRHATMLYSYLLRPTTAQHDLASVVLRHANETLSGAPGEHADQLQRLAPALREEVNAQDLARVYEDIDLPLAPVLAAWKSTASASTPPRSPPCPTPWKREIRALEKRIWELAGSEFNVNSPPQLAEVLFDKLNLSSSAKRGRARARSTAADVLAELALLHELPRKVLEYRELAKLKSTYVDALPPLIEPATGRLHTRFSQTGAATGRLSSSDPNLQNIPVRTELGRQIRAAFVAEPGWTLLSADYSQIELRILAHYSEDPVLLEAFRTGQDIHSRTAKDVFGVGPMAQTPSIAAPPRSSISGSSTASRRSGWRKTWASNKGRRPASSPHISNAIVASRNISIAALRRSAAPASRARFSVAAGRFRRSARRSSISVTSPNAPL